MKNMMNQHGKMSDNLVNGIREHGKYELYVNLSFFFMRISKTKRRVLTHNLRHISQDSYFLYMEI